MRFLSASLLLLLGSLAGCNSSSSSVTEDPINVGDVLLAVESTGQSVDTTFVVEALQDDTVAGRWSIASEDTLPVALEPGNYAFELSGVADNCETVSENPQSLEVTLGSESNVTFQVLCMVPGEVKVTITTTGEDQDDLYSLVFNAGFRTVLVGPYQFVLVTVPVGTYTLELTGVADNCAVQGENPLSLEVAEGTVSEAAFSITCSAK